MCDHSPEFQAKWCAATTAFVLREEVELTEPEIPSDQDDYPGCEIRLRKWDGILFRPQLIFNIRDGDWWPYQVYFLDDHERMEWLEADCRCLVAENVRSLMAVVGAKLLGRVAWPY